MTIHKVNDLSEKAYMYVKGQTGEDPVVVLVVMQDKEHESRLYSSFAYNEAKENELSAIDAIKSSITADRLVSAYTERGGKA